MNQEAPELQHFGHAHALQLLAVQYHGHAVCSACNVPCPVGTAYGCTPCSFFLDETCARTPRAIRHPGHPDHTLVLRAAAPTLYTGDSFPCDACGGRVTSFSFHCADCEFALHIACANAPLRLRHGSHGHPLALAFSSPYGEASFACDVCGQAGGENSWVYHCAPCGFDAHIGCVKSPPPPQGYYQSQPSARPPGKDLALESQPGAVDDAVAVQMMGFYMQQAQVLNQVTNSMFQMHQQRLARPFVSTWPVEESFVSAPTVPRPDAGGFMSTLMQNATNMSLDAGISIAAAAAPPVLGAYPPPSGVLGQVALGEGSFGGEPASYAGHYSASFPGGSDASGMANSLGNCDWFPIPYPGFDPSPASS